MTMAQMRLFLREGMAQERRRGKQSIGAIRLAVWGDADDVKEALKD